VDPVTAAKYDIVISVQMPLMLEEITVFRTKCSVSVHALDDKLLQAYRWL
jgi:hypothetical protein